MDVHADTIDLLGAWALGSCEPGEAARVEAHLDVCDGCATQARRLGSAANRLGMDRISPPPPHLRRSVLAAARARRAPRLLPALVAAYAEQTAALDELLGEVAPGDWERADARHGTLGGVLAHLAGNDRTLAADLGLPAVTFTGPGPAARAAWRVQSRILTRAITEGADLDRPVRLAGGGRTGPPLRPLRDALVQRAFETWTHLDDVAATLGRSGPTPPADQVRRIVDLAVRLLPGALAAGDVSCEPHAVLLVLDGPGGGEWILPPDRAGATGPAPAPRVTIQADALEFVRLVANRRTPETLRHRVKGDPDLAGKVLRVATTLGCD
jgi:uncharacterized protein (TIGR03083 family)